MTSTPESGDAPATSRPRRRAVETTPTRRCSRRTTWLQALAGRPRHHRRSCRLSLEADGVVSLRFANLLPGYPGWFWTVSLARVEE